MATKQQTTGLTYADLERMFPEVANVRRELIDGELIVAPSPSVRHQRVVRRLTVLLDRYAESHGGEVFSGPLDVFLSDTTVVEPDVLFVRAESSGKLEKKFVRSAPDLVVEVSSPSTRRLDLVKKRELYEHFGVPEYWYVDLDAERVEAYRLVDAHFASPLVLGRGETLESPILPGLSLSVNELLGSPEDEPPTS